jgi:hypothetical protein
MKCKLKELAGARGLWVSVILRNEGNVPLLLPYDREQLLYVSQANAALWWKACETGHPVYWEASTIKLIKYALTLPEGQVIDTPMTVKPRLTISQHSYLSGYRLQPGEQWERSTLIPVSPDSVAYLLRVQISACRHVALWHVVWHRLYCIVRPPRFTWFRESHVFAEEH